MRKSISILLVCFALIAEGQVPKTLEDNLTVTDRAVSGPALIQIVRIARANSLPIGIVIPSSMPKRACDFSQVLPISTSTVSQFLTSIHDRLPEYKVELKNGVMLFRPVQEENAVTRLLSSDSGNFTLKLTFQAIWR